MCTYTIQLVDSFMACTLAESWILCIYIVGLERKVKLKMFQAHAHAQDIRLYTECVCLYARHTIPLYIYTYCRISVSILFTFIREDESRIEILH